MALIFALSAMRMDVHLIDYFPLRDKGVHLVEYLVLGGLVSHAAMRTWPEHSRFRTTCLAIVLSIAWAISDEFHQAFVPGRTADVVDLLADAVGATVGAFMRLAFEKLREPSEEDK